MRLMLLSSKYVHCVITHSLLSEKSQFYGSTSNILEYSHENLSPIGGKPSFWLKNIQRKSTKGENEAISHFGGTELQLVASVRRPTPLVTCQPLPLKRVWGQWTEMPLLIRLLQINQILWYSALIGCPGRLFRGILHMARWRLVRSFGCSLLNNMTEIDLDGLTLQNYGIVCHSYTVC